MTSETAATLDVLDSRFLARLKPWQDRVSALVAKRLGDAAAHAHLAVTDSLRNTPDGRPSSAKARRSPSYQAALARLDDLLESLAGPSVHSLKGMIRSARASFYADSFAIWRDTYEPDLWVSANPKPTRTGLVMIRGSLIQSADLRSFLAGPIDTAKRSLGPAVVSAANRGTSKTQAKDAIDTWKQRNQAAILAAALGALSDADQRAHTQAALDVLNPKKLDTASLAASSHRT